MKIHMIFRTLLILLVIFISDSTTSSAGLFLKEYKKAEDRARNVGQGIWSQGDKYISPALWRKSRM